MPLPFPSAADMQSPLTPNYALDSPFSSASSASYPNDASPISDVHYDPIPTPDSDFAIYPPLYSPQGDINPAYASAADLDCATLMAWSPPESKKVLLHHQMPRANSYSQIYHHPHPDLKSSLYIPPPVPRQVHLQQTIHSPVPTHPVQQLSTAAESVFDVDTDDWHHLPRQQQLQQQQQQPPATHYPHPHSLSLPQQQQHQAYLNSYPSSSSADPNTSSPPRIKQEEMVGFPAISGYPSPSHELLHQHHRNSISYEPLNLPLAPSQQGQQHVVPSQAHGDPNVPVNSAAGYAPPLLSPLQNARSIPMNISQQQQQQQQQAVYYSPPFTNHQPIQHQHQHQSHPQQRPVSYHPHPAHPQQHHAYQGGTVHPSELSPTDSCASASPLSGYADLSGVPVGVRCDPRYVCAGGGALDGEMKGMSVVGGGDEGWLGERRASLVSLVESEMGLGEMDIGIDSMNTMVSVEAGVVMGGTAVGVEEVAGEEDAEGEDDWDEGHQQQHYQARFTSQHQQQQHAQAQQQQQQSQYMDQAEDGSGESERDSSDREGRARRTSADSGDHHDTQQDPDDESPESSSESSDDDDEFVLNPRSLRRRTHPSSSTGTLIVTHSSYHNQHPQPGAAQGGNGGNSFTCITGEGRSLRPRAQSARYTPYGGYAGGSSQNNNNNNTNDGYEQGAQAYDAQRPSMRRYTSTSSISSAPSTTSSQPRSSSTTGPTTTTTTTTTRRRLASASTTTTSLPIPIPVPNLTKKSRGRRVPTMSSLEDLRSAASGAGRKRLSAAGTAERDKAFGARVKVAGGGEKGKGEKGVRLYLCDVEGCGKCFARGEHLKRHVRSIHTYEKPHRCPYPSCGKDFSRHDNLGQHMRVHKDYDPAAHSSSTSNSTSTSSSGSTSTSAKGSTTPTSSVRKGAH
ncbi:hypothetical protein B0H34DRAFT_792052 [Crassisporium funariophilum]|nr:hypothetical protein B0H34DRAFT_792052 [Crassisporium funariophilum]